MKKQHIFFDDRNAWYLKSIVCLILLCIFSVHIHAQSNLQQHEVRGTIVDSLGVSLAGVSIQVKNSSRGTSTDLHGKFFMEVPSPNSILEISLVGYRSLEVPIQGRNEINLILNESTSSLDEIVVVGFGTQKKITTVGAQSSVQVKDLKLPVRNLSTTLLGRLPGLVGMQRSGEPGNDNSSIFIRGMASLSQASSGPLVLIDGIERRLEDLDPEDMESFSILKDASATAVYGVRGANGVILITTKKGTVGKPKIRFRYSEGISTFTQLPEFLDGVTYMNLANEAIATRGGTSMLYSDERIENTMLRNDPYLYPNIDWRDEVFNDWASNRSANLNISGGSPSVNYYVSAGYFRDNGILKTDDKADYNSSLFLDRYTFLSNLQLKATSTTTIDLGIQGNIKNRNAPTASTADIFSQVMNITPVYHAVTYPDDKLAGGSSAGILNPYNSLTQNGYSTNWSNKLYSNIRVTQDLDFIIPELSFTTMFSFDANNTHSNTRSRNPDKWFATGRDADGNLTYEHTVIGNKYLGFSTSSSGTRQFYTESALNYNKTIDAHDVGAMVLYNQRDYIETGGNFISSLPYRSRGLAGRVNYAYSNKYLAEFNFGYNGSENFLPEKRYGFFPSFGLGWVASHEKFFEPLSNVVQFLKFRFTHGLVGNAEIAGTRFAYIGTIDATTGYSFGLGSSNNSFSGLNIGEPPVDVTWETSEKTNLGIELHTLNNNLGLQFDLFKERREGIFLRRGALPTYLGVIKPPYGNVGVVKNKGIDASLTYKQAIGDVIVQFQGNFSYAKNEVVENDEAPKEYAWMERRGLKTTQAWGYTAMGLFADSTEIDNWAKQMGDVRPGDIKFKDLNEDGVINEDDIGPIGYGNFPEIIYGFGLNFQYKQFSLGAFFQGATNVDIIMSGEGFQPFAAGAERGNLFTAVADRWTPENPNANAFYPRLTFGNINDNYASNTWLMKDASYLRLKTLQVGYDLPKRWLKKSKINNVNIFMIGYNLLTFSEFKLWDIEGGNGRGTNYPNMKTYSFGIDINF